MTADKVQGVRGKVLGRLDVQSPIRKRWKPAVWAIVVILSLGALSSLVYLRQVSRGCEMPSYMRAPGCGYMSFVPKNASRYVRYPDPSIPNLNGNRCAFVIFSETKQVRISFANYSFQPSSGAGVIVAELRDDGGNALKYSKLDYSGAPIAKTPLVIYYTSDGDEKESSFVIQVSPIESSGSSAGFFGAAMVGYTKTGSMKRHYPRSATHPMAYLAIFGAPPTSQPGRLFTCSPRNSTCCDAISLYRLPTIKDGDTASRITGLSTTSGVKVDSEVTVVMMFSFPTNFDASAVGSTCMFEWDAVDETTMEVNID